MLNLNLVVVANIININIGANFVKTDVKQRSIYYTKGIHVFRKILYYSILPKPLIYWFISMLQICKYSYKS